ncbi:MAG: ABC transporter permease [Chloroflexota bacterium]|nr:ABC transporter permease [Chloroflexota bacterium]MDH5242602.1 ABC transporter permease [Chloroflexota bacterium]
MSLRRTQALFRRVVREIRRDRPSIALLFIAPLVVTGLLTFILREGETPTIDALIVNQAGQPGTLVAAELTRALEAEGATVQAAADEVSARTAVADESATVAVLLPADLATAQPPTITILTNGLDPSADGAQVAAVQRAFLAVVASAANGAPPTIEHTTIYGVPSSDPLVAFAPALVAFFAYFFVYLLTGVSFLRERTGGTLERLMATPVARGEIVTGYSLGFGLFATLQVALLLVWVIGSVQVPSIGPLPAFAVGLGVDVAGSPVLAFLVVVVLALGAVSLGIFLSTFARTELQVIQFIPIVLTPQFLLSGVLFPISSLPAVLQPLTAIMPLTYAVDGLRQIFVRGADLGIAELRFDILVLVAFAIGFATVASLTIRREIA